MTPDTVQLNIDLDYYNISILSVDGVAFSIYAKILNAMEIPWAARTDNDQSRVPKSSPQKWRPAGLNRALALAGETDLYESDLDKWDDTVLANERKTTSKVTNLKGVFLSKHDLERDLVEALEDECFRFTGRDTREKAVDYFQKKKAVRMRKFLAKHGSALSALREDDLASPLSWCV